MKTKLLFTLLLLNSWVNIYTQSGSINNIFVEQQNNDSGLVDVFFDLQGENLSYYINLEVSFDGGINFWPIPSPYLSGDMGPIMPGGNYHVLWDGMQSFPNRYSNQSMLKIIATVAGSLNPCPGTPTITDIDGNVYNTEQIGNQCWMKENLRTSTYNNGVNINSGLYWYQNNISWKYIYGALYSWEQVVSNANGLCPIGWHIPTEAEFAELQNYIIGGENDGGQYLKSCRQVNSPLGGDCNTDTHPRWDEDNEDFGIDEYGFSGIPAGFVNSYENFYGIGEASYYWSTSVNGDNAYSFCLAYNHNYAIIILRNISIGNSIRCLKD